MDNTKPLNGLEFEKRFPEVQTRRVKTSQAIVENLIAFSGTATASGTIASGEYAFLTTTLTPDQLYKTQTNMAIPMVSLWEGTAAVGSMQIFPGVGSGITAGKFEIHAGFDLTAWEALGTPAASLYRVAIRNTAGTTANIYAETRWRYIQNNAGLSA